MATIDNFMNALAGFGAGVQGNGQEFLRNLALRKLGDEYQSGSITQDQYLNGLAAYDPIIARQRAGVGLPAPVILANEFDKARQSGNTQRMNDLAQFAKIYDKGVMVGGGNPAPQYDAPQTAAPQPASPPNSPLGQTDLPQDFLAAMTGSSAPAPTAPASFAPMPGYADSVAQIEATKAGATQDAKNTSDINAVAPKARAAYIEKGYQSLPVIQRALQSKELSEEFLAPKFENIRNMASGFTTGFGGALSGAIPGSPAFNLRKEVDTLLATAGFDKLMEMRESSPTGAAVGNVTEKELELLQASYQNLMASQSKEQFLSNLNAFEEQRARALANAQKAYNEDYARFGGNRDSVLPAPNQPSSTNVATPTPSINQQFPSLNGWSIRPR